MASGPEDSVLDAEKINNLCAQMAALFDTHGMEDHLNILMALASMSVAITHQFQLVPWLPFKLIGAAYDQLQMGNATFAKTGIDRMQEENKKHGH